MPATIVPTDYIAGLKRVTSESDGSALASSFANSTEYVCIPLAFFTGLISSEAHPATGNICRIMFAFETAVRAAWLAQNALSASPTRWTAARSQSFDGTGEVITRQIIHQFSTSPGGEEVLAE